MKSTPEQIACDAAEAAMHAAADTVIALYTPENIAAYDAAKEAYRAADLSLQKTKA
jgi:hypothetical protein